MKLSPTTSVASLVLMAGLAGPMILSGAERDEKKKQEQEPGPYAATDLGVAMTSDARLKSYPGVVGESDVELEMGPRLSLGGGWRFNDWFRAGGDVGLIIHSVDGANASLTHFPLMANVEFQLPNRSPLVPFFGGGPGVSIAMLAFDDDNLAGGDFIDGISTDSVFVWQAYAGLRFRINDVMSLGAVYKYFNAESTEWNIGGTATDVRFGPTRTQTIALSLSLDF